MTIRIFRHFLLLCLMTPVLLSAQTTARFYRGSGSDTAYYSTVIPLSGQLAATTPLEIGGTWYHLNAANSNSQDNITNRIQFTSTLASFGSYSSGQSLYCNQAYRFGIYAGDPTVSTVWTNAIIIAVYAISNMAYVDSLVIPYPPSSQSNAWTQLITSGNMFVTSKYGLTTTFYEQPDTTWGDGFFGEGTLTHEATATATNYLFVVYAIGSTDLGGMTVDSGGNWTWEPLYSLNFDKRPVTRASFVDQAQFQGQPMPSQYYGKSLAELLATHAAVTNAIASAATNYTDLDNSPELRRHPILDQFVSDMGSNALAMAAYVQNEIELTDPIAYNNNPTNFIDASLNLGGVNRSALGVFLEGQGSPVEQCSLLIYMLRRAGVPATYVYGPNDGVQMLDTQLSKMLQMQIHGAVYNYSGEPFITNTLISVNYPWVAAYVNGQWIHLFPWIKDTQVTEGLNLYDYMPTNYNNGYKWVDAYIHGDTNIFSLSSEADTPDVLFPRFIQNALLTTAPGVSLDDIGISAFNRRVQYIQWSDFPTPFAVTNGAVNTVHDLTTITNLYPSFTNIFDTVSVRVYSSNATNKSIFTGNLRTLDLHDRKFIIRQQTNGNNYTLTLSLAPYRTGATNVANFSNDSTLVNPQQLQLTLASTNDYLLVHFDFQRHRTVPSTIGTNTLSYLNVVEMLDFPSDSEMRLGDLAAICVDLGRVSQKMLMPWAQEYWNMQNQVKATPSITNTLSPDVTQGTLPYLMGMSYYQRVDAFDAKCQAWHKVRTSSNVGIGLSMLAAKRNSGGTLVQPLSLVHPNVDMLFQSVAVYGNTSSHADYASDPLQSNDDFLRLQNLQGSAQEHQIVNDFYNHTGGISSVKLLRQAQQAGQPGIYVLNYWNWMMHSNLASYDSNIWQSIAATFTPSADNNYSTVAPTFAIAYVTAKPVTNTVASYQGMAALTFSRSTTAGLISGNQMPQNGGWGDPLTDPIYNPPDYNYNDLSSGSWNSLNDQFNYLNSSSWDSWNSDSSWQVTYSAPNISTPSFLNDSISWWDTGSTFSYLQSGSINFSWNSFDSLQFNTASYFLNETPVNTYQDTVNFGSGYDPAIGPDYAQLSGTVSDPVNAVTGEFYIETTDLNLPGQMPLLIRRNYSSQNVDMGDSPFGYGWRPAYQPYLRMVSTNLIYATEMDGTVVAYRQPSVGTNFWKPTAADNPGLNNRSSAGVGSTANLFNNYITNLVSGGNTNYYLCGADGSVRTFQYTSFPVVGTNGSSFARYRPYLQQWSDVNGNSFAFSFQNDNTQPDYGQVHRIQSSNGNFLVFNYDSFAHITDAYTEDGRRLHYDYDSHGDLLTVTLPDQAQISYTYQHSTVVTNGITNIISSHLILTEGKPNGRLLANTYDSLRRVITQAATVGSDLRLVTNATFIYNNNFTSATNPIVTGTTSVKDVFGKTSTFQYTNNLITSITDELGQTITQVWFTNSADAGYYPHSLKSRTDKRGLRTDFQYDSYGNLKQATLTGNLTGGSATNETATYTYTYTSRNLLSMATDPMMNQVVCYYTNTAYPTLPTAIVRQANGVPVSTNQFFYTNVTQAVTNGVVSSLASYGLASRVVRGSVSTSDFTYDGRGFLRQSTRYTGTADPAVVNTLLFTDRGELKQNTDAAGRSQVFAYDPMGRMTAQEVYESGAATPETFNYSYYNENGELVWTDGPRSNPEDYVWRDYDGAGREVTEIHWRSAALADGSGVDADPDNLYSTSFYQYDAFGNQIQINDPLGNYVVQGFDAIGQLVRQVFYGANGVALATNSFAHELGGELSFATNALGGVTSKLYTSTGKLRFQQNPDGSTNSWRYDFGGRLVQEFLPNGNYWQTVYNDAGNVIARYFHNASGIIETNLVQFDARGNAIQTVDGEGNIFTNLFDGLDRIKITAGPAIVTIALNCPIPGCGVYATNQLQHAVTNFYDAAGVNLTNINVAGEKTITTFDASGRETRVEVHSAADVLVRVVTAAYSADHQSVTITNGTGANAVATTTYTDNEGHPVLVVNYPGSGVQEYLWRQFDAAGNLLEAEQCSYNGSINVWATNVWTYDGLNRVQTEVNRDGAVTSYGYDALGDTTNRTMPGGLTWSATYLNDGRIATEKESGSSQTARSMTYQYYPSGSPFAGRLQTITDGRGTSRTNSYDDFLRLASLTTGGSQLQQQTTTTYQYDHRDLLTGLVQSFSSTNAGPSTAISRSFDSYGQLVSESASASSGGGFNAGQNWDAVGRRSLLSLPDQLAIGFAYQADGLMTAAGGSGFGYANNGLITGRTNTLRSYTINQRDGRGRILQTTTTVGSTTALSETMTWRNDGRLNSYTAVRGDFTDSRNYTYSPWAQRLTQETLNVSASQRVTNNYIMDGGVAARLGILTSVTQAGSQAGTWSVPGSGGLDGLSRVAQASDSVLTRSATGKAPGASTITATLDGNPVSVQFDGPNTSDGRWRASLNLYPGSHSLLVSAFDATGRSVGGTNNSFTCNGGATDTIKNVYDGNGNITQRVWVSSSGTTNRIQTLTWDAFNRLINLADRDVLSNGFNWTGIYDGLGRRLRTTYTMVMSNSPVNLTNGVSTVDSWYDPQAEFLEVGVVVNGSVTLKTYGPDVDGTYGGMNGVGGLEMVSPAGYLSSIGVVQDFFGNVLGSIKNSTITWSGARFSSYGPLPGGQPPALSLNATVDQATSWRGKRVDETGFIYLGARVYDPVSGRFASADPFGHAATPDLYSFAHGDPVNFFDPSGLFGRQSFDISSLPNIAEQVQREQDFVEGASGLVDMVPILGGLKMWGELNSGRDMFTGQRVDGNAYLQGAGIILNFLAVLPPVLELGAPGTSLLNPAEPIALTGGIEEEALAAETRTMAGAAETSTASTGAGQSVVVNVQAEANVASSASKSILPYRQGVNYSLDTFSENVGASASRGASQQPALAQSQVAAKETSTAIELWQKWPNSADNKGGFLAGYSQSETAQVGSIFSRLGDLGGIGGRGGRYVSPMGTPLGARGLPSGYPNQVESLWMVVKPFKMDAGLAAPWKDAPGLGIQYKLPMSISDLEAGGFIKPHIGGN